MEEIKFSLGAMTAKNSKMLITNNGQVTLSGFFADSKVELNHFYGYFIARLDKEQKSVEVKTYPISAEVQRAPCCEDLLSETPIIIQHRDGSQTWLYEYISAKSNNLFFGNILLLDLKTDGSLNFETVILKNQIKAFATFSRYYFATWYSFLPIWQEDSHELAILFNDNPKNINEPVAKYPHTMTAIDRSELALVRVDTQGNQTRRAVARDKADEIRFATTANIPAGPNTWAVVGVKEKELWLGSLTLK
jgi:hypothetical protein